MLASTCICNEQGEIEVSSKDFSVFLFKPAEPEVRVAHLSMTEESVELYKYSFANNSSIPSCFCGVQHIGSSRGN